MVDLGKKQRNFIGIAFAALFNVLVCCLRRSSGGLDSVQRLINGSLVGLHVVQFQKVGLCFSVQPGSHACQADVEELVFVLFSLVKHALLTVGDQAIVHFQASGKRAESRLEVLVFILVNAEVLQVVLERLHSFQCVLRLKFFHCHFQRFGVGFGGFEAGMIYIGQGGRIGAYVQALACKLAGIDLLGGYFVKNVTAKLPGFTLGSRDGISGSQFNGGKGFTEFGSVVIGVQLIRTKGAVGVFHPLIPFLSKYAGRSYGGE